MNKQKLNIIFWNMSDKQKSDLERLELELFDEANKNIDILDNNGNIMPPDPTTNRVCVYDKTTGNVRMRKGDTEWFDLTICITPDNKIGDLKVLARLFFGQDQNGNDIFKDILNPNAAQILNPIAECNNPAIMADGHFHNLGITIKGFELEKNKTYKCTFIPKNNIREKSRIADIPPCTGKLNETGHFILILKVPTDTIRGAYDMELEEVKCPICGQTDYIQPVPDPNTGENTAEYICNQCGNVFDINTII